MKPHSANNNNNNNKSITLYIPKQEEKKLQTPKKKRNRNKPKQQVIHASLSPSRQTKSKKSPTGASFNDGFDCVNKVIQPKVRYEDFDEVVDDSFIGSVDFLTAPFPINPGMAGVFPRLSKFAALYERYKFTKLEFYFQHSVSQFNLQGQQGVVILSALYDAASPGPSTKSQQEMTDPHVVFMPNQNALLKLDPRRLHPNGQPLFVRSGHKPGGTDIKTYDAGNLWASSQGNYDSREIGELHARGTCAFYDELVDGTFLVAPVNDTVSVFFSTVAQSLISGIQTVVLNDDGTPNNLQAVNTAGNIVVPPGNYMVTAQAYFITGVSSIFQMWIERNSVRLSPLHARNTVSNTAPDERYSFTAVAYITVKTGDIIRQIAFVTGTGASVVGSIMFQAI